MGVERERLTRLFKERYNLKESKREKETDNVITLLKRQREWEKKW